uniref:Argininosuccinate lyase n=1 Tax=Cacopsylla melanoneura TaxID=428564 RepID=A0A8D9A1A1_9HEMI
MMNDIPEDNEDTEQNPLDNEKKSKPLWNSCFQQSTNEFLQQFNECISVDEVFYHEDIAGSIAHVTMLAECKIIETHEKDLIVKTLKDIEYDIEHGKVELKVELEDIHMNIESELIRRIGNVGRKLHTGRSRNDQVAVDLRLFTRKHIKAIVQLLLDIVKQLSKLAHQHKQDIMPGFTHFQFAQPISLGHYLLAYASMFRRDIERLLDCRKRVNENPLGSAALAGTTHPIDRYRTTELLHFDSPCGNSLDGISDRDFIIELLSSCSITVMHLSRISEEFIIFMNPRFDYVSLPDSLLTGSSIMPQKKNPDILELIRGKTGRVYGNLFNILTVMKSQPLAYNKDSQECKQPLVDTVETLDMCLTALKLILNNVQFNTSQMYTTAGQGFSVATDIADYLVKKNIPFRSCHEIVGKIIKLCIQEGKKLHQLSLEELKNIDDHVEEDIYQVLSVDKSVEQKDHVGATSPRQVQVQVEVFEKFVTDVTDVLKTM